MMKQNLLLTSIVALALSLGACGHEAIGIDPNAPDEILFQEGLTAYNALDYASAITTFNELLSTYPDSPRHDNSGYLIGRSHYIQGRDAEALVAFTDMMTLHPDSTFMDSGLYFRGRARFKLAKMPMPTDTLMAARVDFEASIVNDPLGVYADNATYYIGRSYFDENNFTMALMKLADVKTNYPMSSYVDNALYYTGRTQNALGQYANAIASFDELLGMSTSTLLDNARYRRGRANYAMPNLAAAKVDFEDIETTYSASIFADNALYYRVRIEVDSGSCMAAQMLLTKLMTSFPASAYISRAQGYAAPPTCP